MATRIIDLTPAKERILKEAFYPFHFLTADQVTRLLYKPGAHTGVQKHLYELATGGYLNRFELPTGYSLRPYIYMFGTKGKQYIRKVCGWEVPKLPKLSVVQMRSHTFLMHLLEVNNVLIAAKLIEKSATLRPHVNTLTGQLELLPAVYLESMKHDLELKRATIIATTWSGKKIEVIPDGLLDIRTRLTNTHAKRRRVLWIEVERGTNNDKDILNKLHGIYDVFDRSVIQEKLGTYNIRVCYFSTAGAEDIERLRMLARRMLHERHGEHIHQNHKDNTLFNFIEIPPMGKDIDVSATFLQSSWLHPYGNKETYFPIIDIRGD